jgi:hypothetical protein
MNSIHIKAIALFCIAGLVLSACKNPFIDRIMNKADMDEEDFGPGASVDGVFNVGNAGDWASANTTIDGGSNCNYVINIVEDFDLAGVGGANFTSINIKVSIRGNHKIRLSSPSFLLYVDGNQTLILRSPLEGNVFADSSAKVIMRDGASITNSADAGLALEAGSVFTMYGGTISGNTGGWSGGVYVSNSVFTMYGGTISGNTATHTSGGGGVGVLGNSAFFMHGGTIKGNISNGYGGGVWIQTGGGAFIKTGGFIYGNDAGGNSNRALNGGHAAYKEVGSIAIDYTLKPRVSGFVSWP